MENLDESKNKTSFFKSWKNIAIVILSIFIIFAIFSPDKTSLNKINELESQLQEQENKISTLQTEKIKLNNKISVLEEDNKTLNKQIETLEEQKEEKTEAPQSTNANNVIEADSNINTSSSTNNSSVPKTDNEEQMVWVGETGTKYHYQDCRTLKGNGHQITLKQALAEGREPCKVCH